MSKTKASLEPQQERSRESLRKLLKAATEVLGQHGVDGTTIPRIAEHAGLTPGAVYRRFRDKDALLEAAILGILERQDERLKAGVTPATAARIPLDVFAEQLVGGMVTTYRANASMLRAFERVVMPASLGPWKDLVPKDDQELKRELTRAAPSGRTSATRRTTRHSCPDRTENSRVAAIEIPRQPLQLGPRHERVEPRVV